jgi:spore maturation protein CgeB
MKILIAGDWHSELHEEPVFQAFHELGHETLRFAWHTYFTPQENTGLIHLINLKFQRKYLIGPIVNKLNSDLLNKIETEQPDITFIYRGSHIYPKTLSKIKVISPHTKLLGYNNDDPFSPKYPTWQWRHFLAGASKYDIVFAYRHHNLIELKNLGAKRVELLRSWFIKDKNFPANLQKSEQEKYECDVVFIGHFENDFRLECLEKIKKRNWNLKIFGHDYGWHPVLKKSETLSNFIPIKNVWGQDYNKALSAAKISLCFLSKLNRDTYTRRCFEIPASGSMMLAEYTDDLASMFKPGEEADFFSSPTELIQKLEIYLNDEKLRTRIAQAGLKRVHMDGHDVVSRMKKVLQLVSNI